MKAQAHSREGEVQRDRETERAWGKKRAGKGMGMLRREKELGSSSSGVLEVSGEGSIEYLSPF